jgi:two-component system, NtrC family, response regulator
MSKILIIDDDPSVNDLLATVIARAGYETVCAFDACKGMAALQTGNFDVVLLDVVLPDGDGLELLTRIRCLASAPEVIIITGDGDPDAAELAIRSGAWDYLVKPPAVQNITLCIERALTYRREKKAHPLPRFLKRDEIVGSSTGLTALLERVAQAAAGEANVLITGETGTGKELLAHAVHRNSARCRHRFVVVDCAALPGTLVESVLFGHARGAFTGAEKEREGLIRQAHGGTLFLDEVGELPLSAQKAFLRVIQERKFRPVSGEQEIQVNFRLISATNRDLDAMAAKGAFRSDLLFRLRSLSLEVPPLRHRKEDIRPLALHQIQRLCEIYGSAVKGFSADMVEALEGYHWPGNVRELLHAIEEALSVADCEPMLFPHHLPTRIRAALTRMSVKRCTVRPEKGQTVGSVPACAKDLMDIAAFRTIMERRYLESLIRITRGSRKEACRISGLSRTRLFELLKKHNLAEAGWPPPVTPEALHLFAGAAV